LVAGNYTFCYKPTGGAYTGVEGYQLSVMERPTFTPGAIIAAKPTLLHFSFTGAAGANDVVYITRARSGCGHAHTNATNAYSLGASLSTSHTVLTAPSLTTAQEATICYATRESTTDGSHRWTDYVALRRHLSIQAAPRFVPNRFVTSTPQKIQFDRVQSGEKLIFLRKGSGAAGCDASVLDASPAAGTTNTAVMEMTRTPLYTPKTGANNPAASIGTGVGNDVSVSLGDVDNDGLMDLVLGVSLGSSPHGRLHWYRNTGTTNAPVFAPGNSTLDGLVLGSTNPAPTLGDLDGDGDLDLVLGQADGSLRYWRNDPPVHSTSLCGGCAKDNFIEMTGSGSPVAGLSTGGITKAHPHLVDLDGDGDLDLVLGGSSDAVAYYRNTGTESEAVFVAQTGAANPFNGLTPGTLNAPFFVDIEMDGDLDMVIGEGGGTLKLYRNNGTAETASLSEISGASSPFTGIDVGVSSVPVLYDWDGDGDLDMMIGTTGGGEHMRHYLDTATVEHSMNSNLDPGEYRVCYKPTMGGVWTAVEDDGVWNPSPSHTLTVVAVPSFTPRLAIAGMATYLTFSAIADGDFVVLQETSCTGAHSATTGTREMAKTSATHGYVVTNTALTDTVAKLYACYATKESGGDSQDDYVELASPNYIELRQPPNLDIQRTTAGAKQKLIISGTAMGAGDEVVFVTAPSNCSQLGHGSMSLASSTSSSGIYTILSPRLTLNYAVTKQAAGPPPSMSIYGNNCLITSILLPGSRTPSLTSHSHCDCIEREVPPGRGIPGCTDDDSGNPIHIQPG